MSENQNCARMTRAAAKRKASSMAVDEIPVSKKRVVLGELPNMSNVVAVPVKPNQERETLKAKSSVNTSKKQMKKALMIPVVVPEPSVDFESRSVDPQMCEPFANDICAYLREMEVKITSLVDFLIPPFLWLVLVWIEFKILVSVYVIWELGQCLDLILTNCNHGFD